MSSGFSRIPVYDGASSPPPPFTFLRPLSHPRLFSLRSSSSPRPGADPSFIRGFLLVKRLIVLDPASRRRVGTLSLRQPLVVSPLCPLIDLLNAFQGTPAFPAPLSPFLSPSLPRSLGPVSASAVRSAFQELATSLGLAPVH